MDTTPRTPDQQGRLMGAARTALTPKVGAVDALRDAGKWLLLALFGLPLAIAFGPWIGRTVASLGPEGIGIAAVVIAVMWAGNRALKKIATPILSAAPANAPRGVLRHPHGLEATLWPDESKAAHEAGHATACAAMGIDVVDVTLKQVQLTLEASRKAEALPEQAWHQLVMLMAGRAGQERIGSHELASEADNADALRIATRLHEHRAELPVTYDSPANLVELARTAAREVLEANATVFEAIRKALIDKRQLTADDLAAVVAAANSERGQ